MSEQSENGIYQVRCLRDDCNYTADDAEIDLKTAQSLANKHSEKEGHIAYPCSVDTDSDRTTEGPTNE